jgi:F-box domain
MTGKLLDHVAEDILSHLDVDDLKNAELVSKGWQQAVLQSRAWSKALHKKVNNDNSLSILSR